MPELEVVCPSGLSGSVRGWKAKEANLLANRKGNRTGAGFDKMLANCWLTTTDAGPYKDASNGTLDWSKVLTCDRFWSLLRIRAATFGSDYEFDITCADRRNCGEKIPWECDLSALPFKELPEESRVKIAAGDNRFEYTLQWGEHAGTAAYFRLQTGLGEKKAANLIRGQDTRMVVASLASRIIEVDGIEKGKLIRFLDEMEMADLTAMMDNFDEADGGVETTIEIECNHCGLLQDIELPLAREFWLPRSKKRAASQLDRL